MTARHNNQALTLRHYQSGIVRAVHESWRAGHKRPLVCLPTGAGKTVLAADMAYRVAGHDNTAWFVVHRRELLKQTVDTFDMFGLPRDRVFVGMVQTIMRKGYPDPDLIVFDECLVAGTQVDGVNIEDLSVGDVVRCFNHKTLRFENKPITKTFKNKAPDELVIINGSIVCTRNHPIYICEKGVYVDAGEIIEGEHMLFRLWDKSVLERHAQAQKRPVDQQKEGVLFGHLPRSVSSGGVQSDHVGHKQENRKTEFGTNEEKQSNAHARDQGEGVQDINRNGAQTSGTGREWKTDTRATSKTMESAASTWSSFGACGEHKIVQKQEKQVGEVLQDRHRASRAEDCDRSGRIVSQNTRASSPRPKKRELFGLERVDSIEVLERGSDGRYEEVCRDGYVYNLEVADNHNYFANGVLVHNCHHLGARTWRRIVDAYPDAYMTGLTATPARLDGKALGDVFDRLVLGPTTQDLVNQGYLSPYRMIVADVADLSDLRTSGSDYDRGDSESRLMDRAVYGDVIDAYQQYGQAQAIYFCTTIKHSEATAEAFREAGIRAEHFDGNTPVKDRDRLIAKFRAGEIQILSNCELIGEGFDMPACDVVGMLRPTQSLTIYLQQVGRALRPREGKVATLIDHVSNIQRHGSPSEPRAWSLEGKIKTGRAVNEDGEFVVRYCQMCFAVYSATESRCPICGAEYVTTMEEIKQIQDVKMRILEEQELQREKEWALSEDAAETARSYSDLCKIAKHRGYKTGWAYHRAKARGYWVPY